MLKQLGFFACAGWPFVALTATAVQANSLATCTARDAGASCTYSTMPLYNQSNAELVEYFPNGDPAKSMLCSPMAATMAIQALIGGKVAYSSSAFVSSRFVNRSFKDKVKALMDQLKTTIGGGTAVANLKLYAQLASSFPRALASDLEATAVRLDGPRIRRNVDAGVVDILAVAPYKANCKTSALGTKVCSYTRSFGHTLAVNGYHKAGAVIRLHDPATATVKLYTPVQMPNTGMAPFSVGNLTISGTDNRPFGANSIISSAGSTIVFERLSGVDTN